MRRTYRPRPVTLLIGGAVALALTVFGLTILAVTIWGLVAEGWGYWGLASAALFGMIGILLWRMVFAHITVDDTHVIVANILSTRRIPLEEVEGFEVSYAYWGVSAILRDGRMVVINAIYKSNVAHFGRFPTRADRIVGELNDILEEWRVRQTDAASPGPP